MGRGVVVLSVALSFFSRVIFGSFFFFLFFLFLGFAFLFGGARYPFAPADRTPNTPHGRGPLTALRGRNSIKK